MIQLKVWFRIVRIRFLTASILAVTAGLTISYGRFGLMNPFLAALTYLGVISLHVSVDLLNDYFDYRSGIDLITTRTPFSGGTGVLPAGLLSPTSVYKAGILFLINGIIIGLYLTLTQSFLILPILVFAAISTYFYSTKLIGWGIGEILLVFKGAFIVLGTYLVQTIRIDFEPFYVGLVFGTLSASVLFINEFPDYDADKAKGRINLIVRLGKQRAALIHKFFHIIAYSFIILGVASTIIPNAALLSLLLLPLTFRVAKGLNENYNDHEKLIPYMATNSRIARLVGIIVVASYFLPI
ncbi:prenyltransferase [Thermoproteota archaeon]